jgi:hypothetical protein
MPAFTKPKNNRKRHKINDRQRSVLQQHYAIQKVSGGATDLKSIARWFENIYQFTIDLSQISRYLSPWFEYLNTNVVQPDLSKNRSSKWPILEDVLFVWEQYVQNSHLMITGDILKEKTAYFWPALYPDIEPSKFSTGWLENFKTKHQIKSYRKYSKAADVDIEDNIEAIYNIWICTAVYPLADIYNIDKSGLYWKMVPDILLSTEQLSGSKKEKAWISLVILANGDSTKRPQI